MPTITIRNIDESAIRALKALAKGKDIPYNSMEELLRREIDRMVRVSDPTSLPIRLYMTPALPAHYIAEREDGSRWIILATAFGEQAWAGAREYKGNHPLEQVPDYVAKLYLPDGTTKKGP
jgi:hypothetical protein